MAPLWEDVKNAIVDGYVYASDKAEEMTHIGRAKVEILKQNRQMARLMGDIGGRVYDLFESGKEAEVAGDEAITKAVKEIKECQAEVKRWEFEIEKAKLERERTKASGETAPAKLEEPPKDAD